MARKPGIAVWGRSDQAELIRDVVRRARVQLLGAGGDDIDDASDLAKALDVSRMDDLRAASRSVEGGSLWILGDLPDDGDVRESIREAAAHVFVSACPFEVIAPAAEQSEGAPWAAYVPLTSRSEGARAAAATLEQFGRVDAIAMTARCGPEFGTLDGLLFDTMDFITTLMGDVEAVSATLASSCGDVPERLRNLHGHLTINVRLAEGRCASLALSDQAGTWFRGATIIGTGGHMRITEGSLEWHDPRGKAVESAHRSEVMPLAEVIARDIRRLIDGLDRPADIQATVMTLAACEAVRLSCRTRQEEEPAKMVDVYRLP